MFLFSLSLSLSPPPTRHQLATFRRAAFLVSLALNGFSRDSFLPLFSLVRLRSPIERNSWNSYLWQGGLIYGERREYKIFHRKRYLPRWSFTIKIIPILFFLLLLNFSLSRSIFIIVLDQIPWNFYLQQQDNIEIYLKINRFSKYHFFPFHLFHFPFHTKQVYPLVQLYLSSPPRLRLVSTQDASPLPFNTDTSFTVAISTGCFQFTLDVAKLWWSFIDSSQMLESISIDRIFDAICGKARLCNSINHPPRMIIAEGVDASRTMKPSISSLLSIR